MPSSFLTAAQLERLMVKTWGPHFREKVIMGPVGSFRLGDAFEECGLVDPRAPVAENPSSGLPGLWQFTPADKSVFSASPGEQTRAMAAYVRERFPFVLRSAEHRSESYRRYVTTGSLTWPLSPAPRSPHGDPLGASCAVRR